MAASAVIQTRIDTDTEAKASAVLESLGLSIAEAVQLFLTRTAEEGMLPFPLETSGDHDAWFRTKVIEALYDPRPAASNQDVQEHFAARRNASLRRSA